MNDMNKFICFLCVGIFIALIVSIVNVWPLAHEIDTYKHEISQKNAEIRRLEISERVYREYAKECMADVERFLEDSNIKDVQ